MCVAFGFHPDIKLKLKNDKGKLFVSQLSHLILSVRYKPRASCNFTRPT